MKHPEPISSRLGRTGIPSLVILALLLSALTTAGHAQVAPITPSGLNTQVSGPIAVGGKTQYDITGGTRPGGGTNLFHSFGEFGVPTNNIANFLNTPVSGVLPPTSNILARVTGTTGTNPTLSSIYGTIQTTNFPGANLFLMNPAGFLFGPNATVNVGGMMTFTTADYLRLTDNARFNAIPNAAADALLTALPVAAFGFLGSNPGVRFKAATFRWPTERAFRSWAATSSYNRARSTTERSNLLVFQPQTDKSSWPVPLHLANSCFQIRKVLPRMLRGRPLRRSASLRWDQIPQSMWMDQTACQFGAGNSSSPLTTHYSQLPQLQHR